MNAQATIFGRLLTQVRKIPAVDIHSHIDPRAPCAGRLADLLCYHYILREVQAAALDFDRRLGELPLAPEERVRNVLPFLRYIRSTATYDALLRVLRRFYSFRDSEITTRNWEKLDETIALKSRSPVHVEEVFRLTPIERVFLYADYDKALATRDFNRKRFAQAARMVALAARPWHREQIAALSRCAGISIRNVHDFRQAVDRVGRKLKAADINTLTVSWRGGCTLGEMKDSEYNRAFKRILGGGTVTASDRAVAVNMVFRTICEMAGAHGLICQVFFGVAEGEGGMPVPFFDDRYFREFKVLLEDFPRTRFDTLSASLVHNFEQTIYAKLYPNVYAGPFWWYNLYPAMIREGLTQRLEAVPFNKINMFLSDAYHIEWIFGKLENVRRQIAWVLAQKVSERLYSEDLALEIARHLLHKGPMEAYGLSGSSKF